MSNSSLISGSYTSHLKRNHPRNNKILKITPHHCAGNMTFNGMKSVINRNDREMSCNYLIQSDGQIFLFVNEEDRSWCSSNAANDHQAITIEVANDGGAPNWHVSDKALNALIELCVDICKRNDIPYLNFTEDSKGNLTQHNYFTATACPGPYLKSKFPYIVDEVNKRINWCSNDDSSDTDLLYRVQTGAFGRKANAEALLNKVKAAGFDTYMVKAGDLYKIQVGAYSKKANAEAMAMKLNLAGFDTYITTASCVAAPSSKKSIDEIAREVIQGLWGNGQDRKLRIINAGYDYSAVQKRVTELL